MTKHSNHAPLKIITVNIPEIYLDYIQELMDEGICPSRSEYIRWCVGNQIKKDFKMLKRMKRKMSELKNIRKELRDEGYIDEYDNVKYVQIPGRENGEEFVKIIKRLEY